MRSLIPALLLLTACPPGEDTAPEVDPPPPLVAGAPRVGAAESTLKLPVGTPLSGFTARCSCLSGFSKQDERDSAYTVGFVESTGVHVRPTIKAVWIENGDQHFVMTKSDVIYSFDGLVDAITARLEELTGENLQGQVTHAGNHNHSSYGTYSAHVGFYLGSDKFNRENFERMVEQHAQVAFEAYNNRRDAAIGMGRAKNWDPNDRVYSDRRGENNDLVVWPDAGPEQGGKDPYLHVMRFDEAATGAPIALVMGWGMHPYVFGEDKSMVTGDATVLAEMEVAETFDEPVVVMHLQTAAGDLSVRGSDHDWATMETVGVYARDAVLDLYNRIPTSSEPILLEATARAIKMHDADVRVTRNGEVDWHYLPYEEERLADDIVYDEQGKIISPLDEWNTEFGAVFCGSGDFDLPIGGMPTSAPAYSACMNVSLMSRLLLAFFRLEEEEVQLPLDGMVTTYTAAARISPMPMVYEDGTEEAGPALFGFFPGEPVSMYAEQWRRRTKAELGYDNSVLFGYAMDHEGYLLIPEDWLRGGYEPDISFRGPLSGEYIMESVMAYVDEVLGTDGDEPFDTTRGPWKYDEVPMPTEQPDLTPEAGRLLTTETKPEYLWVPEEIPLDLEIPATMERVKGMVQVAWEGGDPGVDDPRVTLQRQAEDGSWEIVRSHAGRPINDDMHDFALGHTPDPLFPAEAEQRHYWWVVWQAAGHIRDRAGLPAGRYRLHIAGKRYVGGNDTYPWDTAGYELSSPEFEVVPATLDLAWDGASVLVSLRSPEHGFRMIDIEGDSTGDNPVRGELTVQWQTASGPIEQTITAPAPENRRTRLGFPEGETVYGVTVTDGYGNTGTISLPI